MKLNMNIVFPILKATVFSLAAIIVIILIISKEPQALSVNADIRTNINLNDDNIVNIVQSHTDTTYLHKIEIVNSQLTLQLHFDNMIQLVEHLDELIDEYSYFYLNTINNVEMLTMNVSVESSKNLIYKVKLSKLDYIAGKTPEIVPLSS